MNKTINILIRTCKRPNYFKACIKSINDQTYKEIQIYVGIELGDKETEKYVKSSKQKNINIVYYERQNEKVEKPKGATESDYGIWFPFNRYLDDLNNAVAQGFIMYLDDDDYLLKPTAIEEIAKAIKSENDLIAWRVQFLEGTKPFLIPENNYWEALEKNREFLVCHISGIGFCFHSKFAEDVNWGYWKLGDYRVAHKLEELCTHKRLINQALTGVQDIPHGGYLIDKK